MQTKDNWFTRNGEDPVKMEWGDYRGRAIEGSKLLNKQFKNQTSIVDYGCGKMTIREYLQFDHTYQPVDIVSRCEGCIECDFDDPSEELPKIEAELAICTGVMGKLKRENLLRLIEHIRMHSSYLLVNELQNFKLCIQHGFELLDSNPFAPEEPGQEVNPHIIYLLKAKH